MAKNLKYGHFGENQQIVYADNPVIIEGSVIHNPSASEYLTLIPTEKTLDFAYPSDPAGEGKHWEQDGYEETETTISRKWIAVDDPIVYRKFSKLKIYGTIVSLPEQNGVSTWEKIKSWLEGKTVGGINGWMAFQLAQEISEDHPLFSAWSEEARVVLGLTSEQFEELLNACILEG